MVYDATAAAAARREAEGEPFTFVWDGDKFTLPSPDEWPVEALDMLAGGTVWAGFLTLLGDEQAARIRKRARLANADVQGILGACGDHFGVGTSLGE